MDEQGFEDIAFDYYKRARRLVKIVIGFTLLILGIALIVLPGPAIVVIPIALAILAGEYVWARKLLRRLKKEVQRYKELYKKKVPPEGGDAS